MSNGKSGLFRESYLGNIKKVEKILKDPKVSSSININDCNNDNENALHCAASADDNLSMILYLLKQGCDPNFRNKHGETPLHYATVNGLITVVRVLTHYGADFNMRTATGLLPFDLAKTEEMRKLFVKIDSALQFRYNEFYKQFFLDEEILIIALVQAIDSSDAVERKEKDVFSKKLVKLFESVNKCDCLIQKLIEIEVKNTIQENTLFRTDSMATKLMANFAKLIGIQYLERTIGSLIRQTVNDPNGYEVDPIKTGSEQIAQENLKKLEKKCEEFLSAILSSHTNLPTSIHSICHSLYTIVNAKFPDSKLQAVGGFIFLRLINAAISNPNMYGLVPNPQTELTAEQRRPLILIAKVMQNLANNVEFGAKESYMSSMNTFVSEKQKPMNDWIMNFANPHPMANDNDINNQRIPEFTRDDITSADFVFLHTLLARLLPKLIEYLPDYQLPNNNYAERASKITSQYNFQPAVLPVESYSDENFKVSVCKEWKSHNICSRYCLYCDKDVNNHGSNVQLDAASDVIQFSRNNSRISNNTEQILELLERTRLPPPEHWKTYF